MINGRARAFWLVLLAALFAVMAAGAGKFADAANGKSQTHYIIIVDNSSSMRGNDSNRQAVLGTMILRDLMQKDDIVDVVSFLGGSGHVASGSQNNIIRRLAAYDQGTYYAPALDKAVALYRKRASQRRVLVFIADGQNSFDVPHYQNELRQKLGVSEIITIGIGNVNFTYLQQLASFGGRNDFHAVQQVNELTKVLANTYQRCLGASEATSGSSRGAFAKGFTDFDDEAFVALVSKDDIRDVRVTDPNGSPGNKAANKHFAAGEITDGSKTYWHYRIVHLIRPNAGKWTFEAVGPDNVDYFIVRRYGMHLRCEANIGGATGDPVHLAVRLENNDGKLAPLPPGFKAAFVEMKFGKMTAQLRDDGKNGGKAKDGVFTGTGTFPKMGIYTAVCELKHAKMNLHTSCDVTIGPIKLFPVYVGDREGFVDVDFRLAAEIRTPSGRPVSSPARLKDLEPVTITVDGQKYVLADDANGGEKAGDGVYTYYHRFAKPGKYPATVQTSSPSMAMATTDLTIGEITPFAVGRVCFGKMRAYQEVCTPIRLDGVPVTMPYEVELSVDGRLGDGTSLWLDYGATDKKPVGEGRFAHRFTFSDNHRDLVVCMRSPRCIFGCNVPGDGAKLSFAPVVAPKQVTVAPLFYSTDFHWKNLWLCYDKYILTGLLLLVVLFIVFGWIWPNKFDRRLYFHCVSAAEMKSMGKYANAIAQLVERKGWYKHERAFIAHCFRNKKQARYVLYPRYRGVIARPAGNVTLMRRVKRIAIGDEGWLEPCPPGDVRIDKDRIYSDGDCYFVLSDKSVFTVDMPNLKTRGTGGKEPWQR
ncbi:MAG: VWA domain-containing protein [Candidatus Lernaella stagnicola]|nr:VWA domain-containing protein [Candidatus Lernaella stagnicola]